MKWCFYFKQNLRFLPIHSYMYAAKRLSYVVLRKIGRGVFKLDRDVCELLNWCRDVRKCCKLCNCVDNMYYLWWFVFEIWYCGTCSSLNTSFYYNFIAWNSSFSASKSYLPGAEGTLIIKGVPPGRGHSIALRIGWTLRSPQMRATRARNFLVWGSAFALTPGIIFNIKARYSKHALFDTWWTFISWNLNSDSPQTA